MAAFFAGELSWSAITIRVLAACVVGLIIGMERELSNHPAGMKTHVLVCLGATIAAMVSNEIALYFTALVQSDHTIAASIDMSRIAAGVVQGIGFIGAGAIIKSKDGTMVTGITTAATLWVTGCIGLAIGFGYFRMALVTFLAVYISTAVLKYVEKNFVEKRGTRRIELLIVDKQRTLLAVDEYFTIHGIKVTSFDCLSNADVDPSGERRYYTCKYFLRIPKATAFPDMMRELALLDGVVESYETVTGKRETSDKREPPTKSSEDDN